jgi:RNA polymerase sigma factor (sigma-70 family)
MVTEGSLIAEYQAELTELITRQTPVFRMTLRKRISPEFQTLIAPDDIIQDACASAFDTLDSFHRQGPDSMERWFRVIMLRRLSDRLTEASAQKRGGRKGKYISPRQLESSLAGLAAMVTSPEKTPSGKVASSEAVNALHAALATLPDIPRRAIWMHFVQGYKRTEIAEVLNKSPSAVNSILYRGLNDLKLRMGSGSSFFSDWPGVVPAR